MSEPLLQSLECGTDAFSDKAEGAAPVRPPTPSAPPERRRWRSDPEVYTRVVDVAWRAVKMRIVCIALFAGFITAFIFAADAGTYPFRTSPRDSDWGVYGCDAVAADWALVGAASLDEARFALYCRSTYLRARVCSNLAGPLGRAAPAPLSEAAVWRHGAAACVPAAFLAGEEDAMLLSAFPGAVYFSYGAGDAAVTRCYEVGGREVGPGLARCPLYGTTASLGAHMFVVNNSMPINVYYQESDSETDSWKRYESWAYESTASSVMRWLAVTALLSTVIVALYDGNGRVTTWEIIDACSFPVMASHITGTLTVSLVIVIELHRDGMVTAAISSIFSLLHLLAETAFFVSKARSFERGYEKCAVECVEPI
jgi:hypothetical protein